MAEIREITTLCKSGKVKDAYELAKNDLLASPDYPWLQRALGWALYYMIKSDVENGDLDSMVEHIIELKSLELLSVENDCMIFDNVQFKIAEYVKNHISLTDIDYSIKLSTLFNVLKDYCFLPSKGHSYLLQNFMKFEQWPEIADFFDWWNLDNLMPDDYVPYVNTKGQKMITLAERAFIANSKALLKLNDAIRIEEFLPKLDALMSEHEEMMYPGYFYGKLLLSLGNNENEALKVIIPFARKKASEFWVWQLLSDVFNKDEEKQLACLLRAVHCRTQESFLGKVRIKLANFYINRSQFNFARFHIDKVVRCYVSNGWNLPYLINEWIHQPWINVAPSDDNTIIDYQSITNEILCNGAEECFAIVTYVDQKSKKMSLIYGDKSRTVLKLRIRATVGDVLRLHYVKEKDGKIKVLFARKDMQLPQNIGYAKYIKGIVDKKSDKEFAFLKSASTRCFIPPILVKKYSLNNGDAVTSLIAYDFDKKKEMWNWICVNIKK